MYRYFLKCYLQIDKFNIKNFKLRSINPNINFIKLTGFIGWISSNKFVPYIKYFKNTILGDVIEY